MKKALSMILVLTMVLALALPAMAEEITETWPAGATSKESTQNVTATYTKESHTETTGDVLYFTIAWTESETKTLEYTGEQATYTWNGKDMVYKKNTDDQGYKAAGWNDGTVGYTITVTNQSNIALSVANTASVNFELDLKQKVKTQNNDFGTEQPYPAGGTTTTLASAAEGVKYEGGTGTAQSVSILYTFAANEASTPPTAQATGTVTVGQLKVVVSKPNA